MVLLLCVDLGCFSSSMTLLLIGAIDLPQEIHSSSKLKNILEALAQIGLAEAAG
jgi:hypothetical protein